MTFKVTILGSSSAKPSVKKHHSAHTLNAYEQFYLIDCGEGTQRRLMECGINPMRINAVFISHLHGDHVFGLFPLISTLGLQGRKVPLDIYAPHPMEEILESHYRWFDTKLPFEVRFHEVDTRQHALIYENNVMEVWTIPLRHRTPCCGYLFREKEPGLNVHKEAIAKYNLGIAQITSAKRGEDILVDGVGLIPNAELTYKPFTPRSYAYLSDTLYSGKAVSLVKGVDLLYHEATFAAIEKSLAKDTGHSTTHQAAKVAVESGAGKLLIGHFSSRYKDDSLLLNEAREIFPNTDLAEEGKTFEIAVKKNLE